MTCGLLSSSLTHRHRFELSLTLHTFIHLVHYLCSAAHNSSSRKAYFCRRRISRSIILTHAISLRLRSEREAGRRTQSSYHVHGENMPLPFNKNNLLLNAQCYGCRRQNKSGVIERKGFSVCFVVKSSPFACERTRRRLRRALCKFYDIIYGAFIFADSWSMLRAVVPTTARLKFNDRNESDPISWAKLNSFRKCRNTGAGPGARIKAKTKSKRHSHPCLCSEIGWNNSARHGSHWDGERCALCVFYRVKILNK